jgi:ribosomal protein L37AE/L43A
MSGVFCDHCDEPSEMEYLGGGIWRCPECKRTYARHLNEDGYLRQREVILP